MSYPLTSVVEKVLDAAYSGNTDIEVAAGKFAEEQSSATKRFVVFSYLRDFGFLWGLHRDGGLKEFAEKVITASYSQNPQPDESIVNELTLIVVWDGMPKSDDSPMNVGGYVTPYDWAVMFSYLLFKSATENNKKPQIRIFILDLKSQEYSGSFGIKTLSMLHVQFPWIQIYLPVGKKTLMTAAVDVADAHVRAALPVGCFGFDHFVSDILELKRTLPSFHDGDDEKRLDYLETAIQLWTANLIKPGDRHTVANLIGPLILANGLSIEKQRKKIIKKISEGSPLRNALTALVYVTGLASLEKSQGGGGGESGILQAGNTGKLGRRENLKFILIDDQYTSGFHHILTSMIFGSGYKPDSAITNNGIWNYNLQDCGSVRCYSQAKDLLEILSQPPKIFDWDMPRKLSLPGKGDILLLDLRLWLDNDQKDNDQKKAFFASLKAACDLLGVSTLLEKDGVFKRAYKAAFESSEQNETAALVLLPLLLSHYDPSLPIVLFSSTHQREVIEMVAHRPNIITDFAKPLLGNNSQFQVAGNILKDLRGALEKAIKLHEARIIWERIENLDSKAPAFYIAGDSNVILESFNGPPASRAISYPLSSEEIRKQLGCYFQYYILQAAYFDFVSIPWEFIEGRLTDGLTSAGVTIWYSRLDVTTMNGDALVGYPKNDGGLLLKQLRHKKAHGDLTGLLSSLLSSCMSLEYWRRFAILEFLVFIDFLEQAGNSVSSPCCCTSITLSDAVKVRVVNNSPLPYSLNLICLIWGEQNNQSFSETTKNVVQALRP
ncbi:MAG TPA: hypothetical protein VIH22_00220 [Cyclobacteriaceae bacterium]